MYCTFTPQRVKAPSASLCDLCKLATNFLKHYVDSSSTEAEVEKAVEGLCNILPGSAKTDVCVCVCVPVCVCAYMYIVCMCVCAHAFSLLFCSYLYVCLLQCISFIDKNFNSIWTLLKNDVVS